VTAYLLLCNLSPEQKADLAKAAVSASEPKPRGGAGKSGDSTEKPADGSSGDKKGSSSTSSGGTSGTTQPQTPTRNTKPERPTEAGIDGFTIRVTRPKPALSRPVDLRDPGQNSTLTVSPSGQTPTAPVVLEKNPQEIRMQKSAARDGSLALNFVIAPKVTVDSYGDSGAAATEREKVLDALPASYNASHFFHYKLKEGANAINVDIEYDSGGAVIDAANFAQAYSQLTDGLEGIPFIVFVATMAPDPENPDAKRPWVFDYVLGDLTIRVDGAVV
jgi:hypothetical protein